ncbi:MAG: SDR family oxidoreductase, partial [Candidatus Neomarinimicrobiota bacterium]
QALWDKAYERFGQVDIWINNAGRSHPMSPVAQFDLEIARKVVETNLMGVIHGSRVALAGMRDQGFGALYNMEGLGSDGRQVPGLAIYGSTKRAIAYLTKSLAMECRGTPLLVGALRPGMVVTDLLTANLDRQSPEWQRTRRIFNILADRVERVAPWLADKILANRKSGVTISRLTGLKIMWRFLTAPIVRRKVIDD